MRKKHVKARVADAEPRYANDSSFVQTITRFWVTVAVIGAILYGSLLLISRTDGFRGLVRQRLEAVTGGKLILEHVHVSPNLYVVLRGIREGGAATNVVPGIELREAAIRFRLLPLVRGDGWPIAQLSVDGGVVRFRPATNATWAPLPQVQAALAPLFLGSVADDATAASSRATVDFLRRTGTSISVRGLDVRWLGARSDAPPVAVVEGASLEVTSVQPFDAPVLWGVASIKRAETDGAEWIRDLSFEWLSLEDQDVVIRMEGVMEWKRRGGG